MYRTSRFSARIPLLFAALVITTGCGTDLSRVQVAFGLPGISPDRNALQTNGTPTVPILTLDANSCVSPGEPTDNNRHDMFLLLNDYRINNNRPQLTYSLTLQKAADAYALRMYQEGFFAHTAPDGSGPSDRVEAAGFCNRFVGENIAYGRNTMRTPDEVQAALKRSVVHNENMLEPRWDYVGIGYIRVPSVSGTEYWWVQLFGQDYP